MKMSAAVAAGAAALGLGACSVDLGGTAFVNERSVSARIGTEEPLLGPDGRCTEASLDPSTLRGRPQGVGLGISECDLVRLKGAPDDVLIGGSGKGEREVQALYQEPSGKKLYLFTDNRLVRIVE